jgi:hypothetical protein
VDRARRLIQESADYLADEAARRAAQAQAEAPAPA